jgi:hypothetical protein
MASTPSSIKIPNSTAGVLADLQTFDNRFYRTALRRANGPFTLSSAAADMSPPFVGGVS